MGAHGRSGRHEGANAIYCLVCRPPPACSDVVLWCRCCGRPELLRDASTPRGRTFEVVAHAFKTQNENNVAVHWYSLNRPMLPLRLQSSFYKNRPGPRQLLLNSQEMAGTIRVSRQCCCLCILIKYDGGLTGRHQSLGKQSCYTTCVPPCVSRHASRCRSKPERIVLGGFQAPFPPAVAHRLLLPAPSAAIE